MNDANRRLCVLAILPLWCASLLTVRIVRSESLAYTFLVWNLILAAVPLAAAMMLERARSERRSWMVQAAWAVVWLTFLPNAPYITTDFLHLRRITSAPAWYDVALLLSFSAAGILFCYLSLAMIQAIVERRAGAATSWLCAGGALLLSGFGIYLGRFLRRNSWEVVTSPISLAFDVGHRVLHPLAHPTTISVTAVYGGGLLAGYVVFRVLLLRPANARGELTSPAP